MPDSPLALRPPEEWDKLRFHWLAAGDHKCVAQWGRGHWIMPDTTHAYPESELLVIGWRYHGPCDPAAIVPDPDNERQRDAVADAMKQTRFASSWDEQARAVLIKLRDLK